LLPHCGRPCQRRCEHQHQCQSDDGESNFHKPPFNYAGMNWMLFLRHGSVYQLARTLGEANRLRGASPATATTSGFSGLATACGGGRHTAEPPAAGQPAVPPPTWCKFLPCPFAPGTRRRPPGQPRAGRIGRGGSKLALAARRWGERGAPRGRVQCGSAEAPASASPPVRRGRRAQEAPEATATRPGRHAPRRTSEVSTGAMSSLCGVRPRLVSSGRRAS
jgi:hypothetical protein